MPSSKIKNFSCSAEVASTLKQNRVQRSHSYNSISITNNNETNYNL
jgi:hypothetical protein